MGDLKCFQFWATSADSVHTGSGALPSSRGIKLPLEFPWRKPMATQGRGTVTSNNMATSVPSDDPSKDDLEQYSQKVKLLTEIWPSTKINELIARLVLNTTGTAFQKLQLNSQKLMTGDKAGAQLLITLLKKALFKCVQRQDEANDSFLARCDVSWSELKAKQIDLDAVHA